MKRFIITSQNDSILRIDYIISLKFHELLNAYRKANQIDQLIWDDTLWLASRNHNLWMEKDNQLAHVETNDSPFYTGKSPGERHIFVKNNTQGSDWCGENCLYISSASYHLSNDTAYINHVAKSVFQTWKTSDGHNRNMLSKQAMRHGASIYHAKDGRIWVTDLFAYNKWNNIPIQLNTTSSNEISNTSSSNQITVYRIKKDLKKLVKNTSLTIQLNEEAQALINNKSIIEKSIPDFSEYITIKSIRLKNQKFPFFVKRQKIELTLLRVTQILSYTDEEYSKWLEQFKDSENGYSLKMFRFNKKNELILAESRLIN